MAFAFAVTAALLVRATGLDGTPPPPLPDRLGQAGASAAAVAAVNCCCCCCCCCPPEAFRSGVVVCDGPALVPVAETTDPPGPPDAAVRPLATELFPGDGGGIAGGPPAVLLSPPDIIGNSSNLSVCACFRFVSGWPRCISGQGSNQVTSRHVSQEKDRCHEMQSSPVRARDD